VSSNISLIRWAGGKGKQLGDLLPFIPRGRVYVEPFGGGASVLLNRPRSEVEVYNDLDSSLVNLFTVVRDDRTFEAFAAYLAWTPYSREEFESALLHDDESDAVVAAAKFYTVLNQGISGKRLASKGDWARAKSDNLATRFVLRQDKLGWIHDRIRHVQIECRDALDILKEWDGAETVFYCDPPYVLETRTKRKYYAVEPGDEYHNELVDTLVGVKGRVVLSGYLHPIYERLAEAGWQADSYGATALMTVHDKGAERERRREVVWRNPQCVESGLLVPLPFI
jgi:DNA adenine methylase